MVLTSEQVLSLAPDSSSASAGKKLADPRQWRGLSRGERALWGECQGSALYQVRVDLSDLAAKCSCPSRKFPCKHAIALMLLAAQSDTSFNAAAEPEWVSEWLDKRGSAAQSREKKAAQSEKPVDAEAQAKRAQRREDRVREGVDALDLWLSDLVRNGLASIERETHGYWEGRAARLVDAQAQGLATRVREIGSSVAATPDWPEVVLEEIGKLALLTEAYRRIDSLPEPLQWDVRQLIGWNVGQEEVIAHGDVVPDYWSVIGSVTDDGERVRVQRTWLRGRRSQRTALVLQFSAGNAPFTELLAPGSTLDADLAFWPGANPVRALILERRSVDRSLDDLSAVAEDSIDALLLRCSESLATQPWNDRTATILDGVRVRPGEPFMLIDSYEAALPLRRGEHWTLAALSGGHPIAVAIEWNGRDATPLAAIADNRFNLLAGQ